MQKNQTLQLKGNVKTKNAFTTMLGLCLLSFLASGTYIAGGLSPLNTAISASVNFTGSIVVLASSLLAYFLNSTAFEALPQICTLICISALKFIFSETAKKKTTALSMAFSTTLLMLIFGVGIQLLQDAEIFSVLLKASQALLCGCTAYFCIKVAARIKRDEMLPVSGATGASLGALYILFIATLSSIDLFSVNIGRIFGMVVILFAVKKYRHIGGAVCGALTTCGVVLCSQTLGKSTMLLACAGLIAGLFIELGTIPFIFSFIASNFVSVMIIGAAQDSFNMLIDSAAATVVFILIPSALSSKILQGFETTSLSGDFMAQNARQRIIFASKTINNVRLSLDEIAVAMDKKLSSSDLVSRVSEGVCSSCVNKLVCWNDNYDTTNNAFFKVQSLLEKNGCVGREEFPNELLDCPRTDILEKEFNFVFREISCRKKQEQKLKEMRSLLSEQFLTMEEMLSSLSGQMSEYSSVDPVCSKKTATYFEKQGFKNTKACAYINSSGKMTVEAYIPQNVRFNDVQICMDISELINRELELPVYLSVNSMTRIEFWEKPLLSAETGVSQMAGSDKEISGDSYELFSDSRAHSYIVLSDGMGSGKRAQLDSLLASSHVSRLIRAGIGCSSSIRLINSYLRVKNWEESFTTLDIGIIDLYGGTFSIVKAGASATYFLRADKIKKLEASSMPIGILQDINPIELTENLQSGDMIITTSDGVPENSAELLKGIASKYNKCSSKEISERITDSLEGLKSCKHCDDITVIVTKIKEYV
ncbi:MAG: SpoIIE family protein phosphatase [Oscillospiraceae bacterium]